MLRFVLDDVVNPSMRAVPRGVRVTDACNEAIKHIIATGSRLDFESKSDMQ